MLSTCASLCMHTLIATTPPSSATLTTRSCWYFAQFWSSEQELGLRPYVRRRMCPGRHALVNLSGSCSKPYRRVVANCGLVEFEGFEAPRASKRGENATCGLVEDALCQTDRNVIRLTRRGGSNKVGREDRPMQTSPENDASREPSVHFIGIGGSGISALALYAVQQGWQVSGSDISWSKKLEELLSAGARVHVGHTAANLWNDEQVPLPDAVVVSTAISSENEEVVAAHRLGVPVFKRDDWLAKITKNYELIAISGSHGKSTTTAMLAFTLHTLGDDISAVVGADVPQFPGGGNAIMGKGPRFVLEADEYDGCFLSLLPSLTLVTNVEWEHVDMFPDEASVRDMFRRFVLRLKPGGTLIVCGDCPGSRSLARGSLEEEITISDKKGQKYTSWMDKKGGSQVITYGLGNANDWRAVMLVPNAQGGTDYVAVHAGQPMARVSLRLPGAHNVLNSLGVIVTVAILASQGKKAGAASPELEVMKVAAEAASKSLGDFVGVRRRFEFVGKVKGCHIYDDYAHHPTEVRAVLQAARQRFDQQPIWVVFQPHTYSRLARLLQDFAPAFSAADRVIVTEVYAAREKNSGNVSGSDLVSCIIGPPALYIPKLDDVLERLLWELAAFGINDVNKRGDIVLLTLGAGDITTLGPRLLHAFTANAGLAN